MKDQRRQFYSLSDLFHTKHDPQFIVAFKGQQAHLWEDLYQDVANLQSVLEHHTAKRVALCTTDSYWFTVGLFALFYSGKTAVLPGNYQPEALNELSKHYDLMLADHSVSLLPDTKPLAIKQDTANKNEGTFPTLDLASINIILFTSGSSGEPKGIEKSLLQIDTELGLLQQLWGDLVKDSRVESTVSHQHIYGLLFRLLWPLCSGRAYSACNLEYPEQVIAHAADNVTLISSPALLKRLSAENSSSPLRAVFSSGGPLAADAAQHAYGLFNAWPHEVFGSTETGGIAHRQQDESNKPWQLFPQVEAQLNQEGCLKLLSGHIDSRHWYQTADACELLPNNRFILKGRTDRIVKIEEKRISLVEVEKRTEQLPWIQECAAIPTQEADRLTIGAAIVLTANGKQQLSQIGKGKFWLMLRKELRQWLEPIAIPRRFRILDEIPLNSQSKRLTSEIEKLF